MLKKKVLIYIFLFLPQKYETYILKTFLSRKVNTKLYMYFPKVSATCQPKYKGVGAQGEESLKGK